MADTYNLRGNGITLQLANEYLLTLFNGSGSGKVLRVFRVSLRNSVPFAYTGTANFLQLWRITAATASNYTIAPVAYDTTAAAIPAQITSGLKFTTVTDNVMILKRIWSCDEAVTQGGTIDETQIFPWSNMWECTVAEGTLQPIVLREGQGISIKNPGFTATAPAIAGIIDINIEFTQDVS